MHTIRNLLGFSALLTLVNGCGGPPGNPVIAANNAAKSPETLKTWSSNCRGSDIFDISMREYYQLNGAVITLVREYHSDASCTSAQVIIKYRGEFEIRDDLSGQNGLPAGTKQMDIRISTVSVTPLNEVGRRLLDRLNACGRDVWKVNEEVDMTTASTRVMCPLEDAPYVRFDIFLTQIGTLRFGLSEGDKDKKTPETRPIKLDGTFYLPVERSF